MSLLELFPTPQDLYAVSPEDLGGVVIEIAPAFLQNGMFGIHALLNSLYPIVPPSYPPGTQQDVGKALEEALSWLVTQGLLIVALDQPGHLFRVSRRASQMRSRTDVEAFRKGRLLPDDLLPSIFVQKAVPLFRRGDYDVAVFQAFKEVEVAVRKAANAKGAAIPDNEVGTSLMRRAFNPDNGVLADQTTTASEREAMAHLFSGAIGHAKNPASHHDVTISAQEAARLIIFAAYLLDVIEKRITP